MTRVLNSSKARSLVRAFLKSQSVIGIKFGLTIMAATGMILVATFLMIMHKIETQDAAHAEKAARAKVERVTVAVHRVFEDAFAVVENTHDDLVALQATGAGSSAVYDTLVSRMAIEDHRFGGWLEWDGPTLPAHVEAARRDAQGRFTSYTHQNGMEMLREGVPEAIFESDLFKVPRRGEGGFLLEPHLIVAEHGDPTLVTSFARPLVIGDHVAGVLAVDIKLDAIDDAVTDLDVPKGSVLAIVSDGGIVAAASSKSWIGKPIADVSVEFAALLTRAKNEGEGAAPTRSGQIPSLHAWTAIRFGAVKNPWYLLMRIPQVSLLTTNAREQISLAAIAGGTLLIILAVVMLAMHQLVTKPLARLGHAIDQLGQGLFDIDVPGRRRRDEIGIMARAIGRLQDSHLIIARLHEQGGEDAYQRIIEREARTEALSTQFTRTIETVSYSLQHVAETIDSRSGDLEQAVQAAVARLHGLSQASATTRADMNVAAMSTTSLIESIETINARIAHGRAADRRIDLNAKATDGSLSTLQSALSDVGSIITMIQAIAEQVNLIALNATIEAARAGEAGRGFAVVAQEVKALASQSAKATEAVSGRINSITQAARSTAGHIHEMRDAFEMHRAIARDIAGQLEHQTRTTDDLRELVGNAVNGAEGTAEAAEALTIKAGEVSRNSQVMRLQGNVLNQEIGRLMHEVAGFIILLKAA